MSRDHKHAAAPAFFKPNKIKQPQTKHKGTDMPYICSSINSTNHFVQEFVDYGRGDQFSFAAFEALFEYYTELAEGCGEPFEMDVIGICCDWCEYDTLEDAAEYYDIDEDIDREDDDAILEWFQDNQHVIAVDGGGILVAG